MKETPATGFPASKRHIFNAGTTHELMLYPEYGSSHGITPITVTVLRPFEPFTMSPVLHVAVRVPTSNPNPRLPLEAILKLYDKRYTFDNRSFYDSGPWSPSRELALAEFKAGGGWPGGRVPNPIKIDFNWSEWTVGEMESFLEAIVHNHFTQELAVYRQLHSIQGTDIPTLYGRVTVTLKNPCLVVSGLLLEYIPSFTLRQVPERVPKKDWQWIGDEAVALVNRVSDQGIVNQDVRLDNVLVTTADPKRLVMIDFAMARARREDEDDEAWREVKRDQDEEGAIGFVYKQHLKGEYKYNRSHRYRKC